MARCGLFVTNAQTAPMKTPVRARSSIRIADSFIKNNDVHAELTSPDWRRLNAEIVVISRVLCGADVGIWATVAENS